MNTKSECAKCSVPIGSWDIQVGVAISYSLRLSKDRTEIGEFRYPMTYVYLCKPCLHAIGQEWLESRNLVHLFREADSA